MCMQGVQGRPESAEEDWHPSIYLRAIFFLHVLIRIGWSDNRCHGKPSPQSLHRTDFLDTGFFKALIS
eukprot:6484996-Amphidinium_carterae.1